MAEIPTNFSNIATGLKKKLRTSSARRVTTAPYSQRPIGKGGFPTGAHHTCFQRALRTAEVRARLLAVQPRLHGRRAETLSSRDHIPLVLLRGPPPHRPRGTTSAGVRAARMRVTASHRSRKRAL
jgi:hypothetical protein